jgi:hypothetical protein
VANFFECHHSNHYMIFNLTEKHYDPGKFRNRVRPLSLSLLSATSARARTLLHQCCMALTWPSTRIQVRFYGWPDHHPPPMGLLYDVVKSVHEWLEEDRHNVAAIHCKVRGLPTPGLLLLQLLSPGLHQRYMRLSHRLAWDERGQ